MVYVPGLTPNSFCPSESNVTGEPPLTTKEKSVNPLVPPLSLVISFLTIKVDCCWVFVKAQTTASFLPIDRPVIVVPLPETPGDPLTVQAYEVP